VHSRRSVGKNDRLAAMMRILVGIMDAVGIDERSCSRSNRVYSVKQKLALLVLRQHEALSFRDLCDKLPSYRNVCRTLGLKHVPHHTTLAKFAQTVSPDVMDSMISRFSCACCNDMNIVAVDGTGFSDFNRSAHYEHRLDDFGAKARKRGFTKATFAADVSNKIILVCDVVDQHNHDVTRMGPVISRLKKMNISIDYLVADKGYDSEDVHVLVEKELNATAVIPARLREPCRGGRTCRTKGKHRSRMKREFVKCTVIRWIYRFRSIIECVNSMVKRKMKGWIFSKLDTTKRNEVQCRAVAHNLRRIMDLGLQRSFI